MCWRALSVLAIAGASLEVLGDDAETRGLEGRHKVTLQDMRTAAHEIEKVFQGVAHAESCGVVAELSDGRVWRNVSDPGGKLPCGTTLATDCSISYHQMECPEECPFIAPDLHFPCQFTCLNPGKCAQSNIETPYPDPRYNLCTSCSVVGCKWCDSPTSCKQCHHGFIASEDGTQCIFEATANYWPHIVAAVLVGLIIFLVIWGFISCCCGSKSEFVEHNRSSVDLGLRHRHLSKVHDWDLASDKCARKRYSLFVELDKHNVLGVGFGLFYNGIFFILAAAIITCFAMWHLEAKSQLEEIFNGSSTSTRQQLSEVLGRTDLPKATLPAVIVSPMLHCATNSPDDLTLILKDYASARAFTLLILYVVLLFVSLIYVKTQKDFAKRFDATTHSMTDFAVLLRGFPPEATNEVELKKWAQEALLKCGLGSCEVEGVSIGYDFGDRVDKVNNMTNRFCSALELEMRRDAGGSNDVLKMELDYLEKLKEEDRKEVRQWFDGAGALKGTGDVFLVLKENTFKDKIMAKYQAEKGIFQYKNKIMEASVVKSEPPDVFWSNLHFPDSKIQHNERCAMLQIFFYFCCINVLVFLWNRSVVMPYLSAGSNASGPITILQGIIMGIINGQLGGQVWKAAYGVGYHRKDRADVWLYVMNLIMTFCNTMFSLLLVCYSVLVMNKEKSMTSPNYLEELSSASPVGIESSLAYNVYLMLIPGQFFINPLNGWIMGGIVPYLQNTLLANVIYVWYCLPTPVLQFLKVILPSAPKDLKKYDVLNAEDGLRAPQIGLPWDYSNLVLNPFLVFLSFFLVSTSCYQLSMFLALYAVFSFIWFRFMHLRVQSASFYSTDKLDWVVRLTWGAPLSTLASCAVAWNIRAGEIMSTSGIGYRWLAVLATYAMGCIIWVVLVLLIDPAHKENVSDQKSCTFAKCKTQWLFSWFNSNPIYTLKCLYYVDQLKEGWDHPLASGDDPTKVRFYSPGKEFLHIAPSKLESVMGGDLYDKLEFETWLEGLRRCICQIKQRGKVDPRFMAEEMQQLLAYQQNPPLV